ncbi:hypothetical protein [Lacticaseibacillus jixiensis]|uniref:hypothetical protein n=1 Tax=Lacticaseibacillus jixiensis TaxID=3231926 RepID=UPI0036F3130F
MDKQKLEKIAKMYSKGYNEFAPEADAVITIGSKLSHADKAIDDLQKKLKKFRKDREPIKRADKKAREALEARVSNFSMMLKGARMALTSEQDIKDFNEMVNEHFPLVTIKDFATHDFQAKTEKSESDVASDNAPAANEVADTQNVNTEDDQDDQSSDSITNSEASQADTTSGNTASEDEAVDHAESDTSALSPSEVANGWTQHGGEIHDADGDLQRLYEEHPKAGTPQADGYRLQDGEAFNDDGNVVDPFGSIVKE